MHFKLLVPAAVAVVAITLVGAPGATAAGKYSVSLTASSNSVVSGTQVTFSGSVSPAAAGKKVYLQKRSGSKWVNVASKTLSRGRTFAISVKVAGGGVATYRVQKPASNGRSAGVSPARSVAVYRWIYLSKVPNVSRQGFFGSVDINGTTYANSYYDYVYTVSNGDYGSSTEFNLSRKCTQFRATVGLRDDSFSGAQDRLRTLTDGTIRDDRLMSIGQSAALNLNVTNVLRLKLFTQRQVTNYEHSYPAWGNARVLCRF